MSNVYQANGYKDRSEYLHEVAGEYDVPYGTVAMMAAMLGESEDFDGLITMMEDYEEW